MSPPSVRVSHDQITATARHSPRGRCHLRGDGAGSRQAACVAHQVSQASIDCRCRGKRPASAAKNITFRARCVHNANCPTWLRCCRSNCKRLARKQLALAFRSSIPDAQNSPSRRVLLFKHAPPPLRYRALLPRRLPTASLRRHRFRMKLAESARFLQVGLPLT